MTAQQRAPSPEPADRPGPDPDLFHLGELPRAVPRATYRLQFQPAFTFDDARAIAGYISELGASTVYASPIFTPRAGSTHGYDICDHGRLNPELGGEAAFTPLSDELRRLGLGLILDVVPNHMGIGDPRNLWWLDVLENGPSSIFAGYFDIDWNPAPAHIRDKVLLPVLGDQFGNVLERGELRLALDEGALWLTYWENRFPIAPGTYSQILGLPLDELLEDPGPDDPDVQELQSIITAVGYLPSRTETSPESVAERNREKEVIKRRLAALYAASERVRVALDEAIARVNGVAGRPASFQLLEQLIDAQVYRLAFWRVATEEINYRRFFDINDLAAIRVERPDVLQATHHLAFRLLSEGRASGLRVDHPDGLRNPPAYFRQLQESYLRYWVAARLSDEGGEVPEDLAAQIGAWIESAVLAPAREAGAPRWPLYVVAEKILSDGEALPESWAVDGTTGYDFLNDLNGIFVDGGAERSFTTLYRDFLGEEAEGQRYGEMMNQRKKQIMLISLASEVNALSNMLEQLAERTRRYRDFTLNSLTFAIREIIAALDVYRTYVDGAGEADPRDTRYIERAAAAARRRNPRTPSAIFDFVRDTALLRNLEAFPEDIREAVVEFAMKFQQLTGPVMAKGVEDTLFYVYNRFVALNEVGGHPDHFGLRVGEFHERNAARRRRWPHTMLASSTHDTKRGEDVRARLAVLSELPREWRAAARRWARLNARHKTEAEGRVMPSRNDEYLLYQTIVGAWPEELMGEELDKAALADFRERVAAYMEKATKEAKVHTNWINPDEEYDRATGAFVRAILTPGRRNTFLPLAAALARRVAAFGRYNGLSQALLKLTAPGVPDIYQGCELWNLSLVDPDNRRPVDYELRRAALADQRRRAAADPAGLARELAASLGDGMAKLYVTWRALELRAERPQLFAAGDYTPLAAQGPCADHVVAFARREGDGAAVVVAPRLPVGLAAGEERPPLGEVWRDTWLPLPFAAPGARYRDRLTGAALEARDGPGGPGLPLAELLGIFPVALLVQE